jgi:hypothetical protein
MESEPASRLFFDAFSTAATQSAQIAMRTGAHFARKRSRSLGQTRQTHTLGKPGKIGRPVRSDPIFEVGKTQFRIKPTNAREGFLRFVQMPAEGAAGGDISYCAEKIRLFPGRL